MKQNYQLTMTACFAGYVVQAIVNISRLCCF